MSLEIVVNAFVPVLGLLLFGYLSRRLRFLEEGFWAQIERLTYYALMPALILANLGRPDAAIIPLAGIALAIWCGLGAGVVLLIGLHRLLRVSPPEFTSLIQGGVRFNTYIGLALVAPLLGTEGMAVAAVAIGVMIFSLNVISVTAFAVCLNDGRIRFLAVARELARNPLLIACAVGWSMKATGIFLPEGLHGFAAALGNAALPMGVMAVGAALARVGARLPSPGQFAAAGVVKFVVVPGTVLVAATLLELPAVAISVIVLLNAMPTAPSAYVLARQLGGDHALMAALITTQTLFACAVLPIAVAAGLLTR